MPEDIFVGGRLDSVRTTGTVTETVNTTYHDSAYTDVGISANSLAGTVIVDFKTASSGVLSATTVVAGETLWCHWEIGSSGGSYSSGRDFMAITDSSAYPWFRLRLTSNSVLQPQYNSGTGPSPVWSDVGSSFAIGMSRRAFDVKLTLGSPHSFEVSMSGSLESSGTFTQASFTNAAAFTLIPTQNSGTTYFSQLAATRDKSTIGGKVWTRRGTADGTNTGWSGAYTDVNEAVGSDASVQSSTSAGQKETHAIADVTISAGTEISSVWHWMRAKNDGSAPTNIKSVIRSGGADYSTGNLSGIGSSYGAVGARYDADPATAANWTQTSFNGIEAGYESAT